MPDLPLVGKGYRYAGRDERKHQQVAEKNRLVVAISRHANHKIAHNPRDIQVISFASIAHEVGCDIEVVRHALSNGGANGITVFVTDEDRQELDRYNAQALRINTTSA